MSLAVRLTMHTYDNSMRNARNLIGIHRDVHQGSGRRIRELSLNRAIVVLAVAAWQAHVQVMMDVGLKRLEPPQGSPRQEYHLLRASVINAVNAFSTPSAENTRNLMLRLGIDPLPYWTWRIGADLVTSSSVQDQLNKWLKVRHAIAHGDDTLPDVDVLTALPSGERALRLADCEKLIKFLDNLALRTTESLFEELN